MRIRSDQPRQAFRLVALLACCAVISLASSGCGAGEATGPIVVRGSGTLAPIVERWVSAYSATADGISFEIADVGSEEGIADLLQGEADIALSSRPMSPEEQAAFDAQGLTVRETVVARMGIAVVIHPSNPVDSAPAAQVGGVFAGEISSWLDLGGPDEAITVVRKETGWSPSFFQNRVMGGRQYLDGGLVVDSKETILMEVSQRPWAIGVTGMTEAFPALDRVKLLRLQSDTSEADSTYALSRPLFFFTVGDSPALLSFLDYAGSPEAQQSIIETGFFPASQSDRLEE